MKTAVGGLWPNQENPEEQKRRRGQQSRARKPLRVPQAPTQHSLASGPHAQSPSASGTDPGPERPLAYASAREGKREPGGPGRSQPRGPQLRAPGGPELLPALSSAGRRREAARAPRSWRRCLSPRVRASAPQPARTRGPAHRPRPFHTGASLQSLQRFPLPQIHRQQHKANRVTKN